MLRAYVTHLVDSRGQYTHVVASQLQTVLQHEANTRRQLWGLRETDNALKILIHPGLDAK